VRQRLGDSRTAGINTATKGKVKVMVDEKAIAVTTSE